MDTVMQSLFGQMPISQLPSVKSAVLQKNNTQTILIMGTVAIVLGFVAYEYYKENKELKYKLSVVPVNN
jgi:hypothetical protein